MGVRILSSAISASEAPSVLERVSGLYARGLYLQAYQESKEYWAPGTRLTDLSIEELILGLRLAARLGGSRLSRRIAWEAFQREPSHPKVRYYTLHIRLRGRRYFDHFRRIQAKPELEGADPDTQASWLGSSAVYWASIRDFENAHKCLDLAHRWNPGDAWVMSCESDVLNYEDRWDEALKTAEAAWAVNPRATYTARSLAASLLNLRRIDEAANRLAKAAQEGESHELVLSACWYLCALAETGAGEERMRVVGQAQELVERIPGLAPLADRETQAIIARARLDIAELADDHGAMEHWAHAARSPFHRKVLENIRKNPHGQRIRLPFRHAIQKDSECLPTSIGSAMAAMDTPVDAETMAAELTFGGTAEWAAAEWLEKQGYVVRFFTATPEVAAALVKNGFAFVVTLEGDAHAHAVAVVGLDEAAGTVLVHDPGHFRSTEYLIESLGRDEAPLGPKAMVAVRPERAQLLDRLLPQVDVQTMTARESYRRAQSQHGSKAGRIVVSALMEQSPYHPNSRLLKALRDHEDGRIGAALEQFQKLLAEFPGSAFTRSNLVACCRSLRNTALMRKTLADVVERGILPGIESQQRWRYPPPDYVSEYADLLRLSGATSGKARFMLLSLLWRAGYCASAWHNLADLFWNERDIEGALLGYRIASRLADRNEHYAQAYSDALAYAGRQEEGFAWLRQRVERFGQALEGVATWISLITTLEEAGYPERALAAAEEALGTNSSSTDLLAFMVPFQARMGKWANAEGLLKQLESTGTAGFHRACSHFLGMRGELDRALEHSEKWLSDSPLSMSARQEVVNLIARRDGDQASIARAQKWLADFPEHEDIEELYCRQLNRRSYTSWRKYNILLRRTKRNREDGWAWCELAFCALHDFDLAGPKRQRRLEGRIIRYLGECDRTSPGEAVTLRAHANWLQLRREWAQAVTLWTQAIENDPANLYAYQHLWDCAARLTAKERLAVWGKVESALLRESGHSTVARDIIMMAAQRFGVSAAEEAVTRWLKFRPEDPEIVEAYGDLLLKHGHGRTDDERALQMLLPQLNRFPFHLGLRLTQANALQNLGRFADAEEVFHEIVRRHPDNSWSRVRLAWMKHRRGETEAALQELEQARMRDPQNPGIYRARVEILIEEQRFVEARSVIASTSDELPADVSWRENAINLLIDCGDLEQAIATARAGVVEYPHGAYLWLLLGRTLSEHIQFAAQGEVESCLRRSLSLNHGLYEAADYLAMLLVEQRRYIEAEQVIRELEDRLSDPSPALGRLAWIRRSKGEKGPAVEDMMSLLRQAPWYSWGWGVLLDWFNEDQSWDLARTFLAAIVPEQRTHTRLRQRRLEVLARAGEKSDVLDAEWNSLLHDFPEDSSLHLIRYDALRDAKRWPEAVKVLEHIREIYPDSPYVLARWVEVLVREKKKDEAVGNLLRLFFAEAEPSVWPPNHAWEALKGARYEAEAYQAAQAELQKGKQPTAQALSILAAHAIEWFGVEERTPQPFFRAWFPHHGAREILKLLKMVDAIQGRRSLYRATLFQKLSDFGYHRLVVSYWAKNRDEVEAGVESWSAIMRALTGLKKYRSARRVFSGWQDRQGVGMWVVANYIMGLSKMGSQQLQEVKSTCQAALAGLPHDHCARYLAHREAEACALLGDQEGFAECWKKYREYFDGKLEEGEWFETQRRYLLEDIPVLARHLENNEQRNFNARRRSLRWKGLKLRLSSIPLPRKMNLRWWWVTGAIVWLLIQLLVQLFSERSSVP